MKTGASESPRRNFICPSPVDCLRDLLSRPLFQPLLRDVLKLAHLGMNYGGGQDVHASGEIRALRIALEQSGAGHDLTLFDVGAHQGEYCQQVLKATPFFSRVYCFEPSGYSFECLRARFEGNPTVHCERLAMGERSGHLHLASDHEGATTARVVDGMEESSGEEIRVTTVDAFMKDHHIPRVDFLKIDTEGYEVSVLKGAGEAIGQHRIKIIQFEFGETYLPYGRSLRNIFEILEPHYSLYRILRHGIVPVTYSYDWEIYKVSNFICLLNC